MKYIKKKYLILGKKIMNFKHKLSPSKPLLRSTLSLILGVQEYSITQLQEQEGTKTTCK